MDDIDVSFEPLRTVHIPALRALLYEHAGVIISFADLLRLCIFENTDAIIAISQGTIIGIVGGSHSRDGLASTLDYLCVHSAFRRHGLGTALVREFLKTCPQSGTCKLDVRVSNALAQRLYTWCGFRPVGVKPHFYHDEDGLTMMIGQISGAALVRQA